MIRLDLRRASREVGTFAECPMQLFLLTALTMVAFAANSVLNRWAVGPGHVGAVEFACIRVLAGAAMLAILVLRQRGSLVWPGRKGSTRRTRDASRSSPANANA